MGISEMGDDELITKLVNSYEAREWSDLLLYVAEAESRDIDRMLGYTPQVRDVKDRLRKAEVHLKAAKQDLAGDDPADQVETSLRLVDRAMKLEAEKDG